MGKWETRTVLLVGLWMLLFSGKIFLDFFVSFHQNGSEIEWPIGKKKQALALAYDDAETAREALFFLKGEGFVIDCYFDRPQFSKETWHKTALRPKPLVIAHALGLALYLAVKGKSLHDLVEVPPGYLEAYAWGICVWKNLFLAIALWTFYRTCCLYLSPHRALLGTLLFLCFPSVYFFVGNTNMLDTLVMPLEVMFFCLLVQAWKSPQKPTLLLLLGLSFLLVTLCYLKPHHLLIVLILDAMLVGFASEGDKKKAWTFLYWLNGAVLVGFIPIMLSNYMDFREVFLSTQSGFNFFHGHNMAARGSWSPSIWKSHHDGLYALLQSNSQLSYLNEKQESDYYAYLAWQWIAQHPWQECELMARKVAIFFLPHNFMHWKLNGYNLLVELGFLSFCVHYVLHFKQEDKALLFFFVPIAGILLVNVFYFVEYRWRYYAEPFMAFFAYLFLCRQLDIWKKKYV